MILLSTEEQLKVGDECRGQLTQGNITYLVAMLYELFQMVANGAILPITAFYFDTNLNNFRKIPTTFKVIVENFHYLRP